MKQRGHFCKICGEYKANEKFSGKGHAAHICKQCAKLPIEKRNEMQTVNRLLNLPFRLSKEQRSWLEKMRKSQSEEIRGAAEWAWESRFAPMTEPDDDTDPDELAFGFEPEAETDDEWNDVDIDPYELPF